MSSIKSRIAAAVFVSLALLAIPASQAKDGKKPRMLVFSSKYCGPCQEAQPAVDAVIKQCKKRKVEIEEYDLSQPGLDYLATKFRLIGTPTFVFLDKDGAEVARLLGKQSESALKQALSALLGEPCPGLELLKPIKKPGKKKTPRQNTLTK